MSEFRVPDRLGVEYGWRVWMVVDDIRPAVHDPAYDLADPLPPIRPLLLSPVYSKHWEPFAAVKATCSVMPSGHKSPLEACSCGIYAATEPLRALRTVSLPMLRPEDTARFVLGRVAAWGKIIPGTHGFRAERAYPSELVLLNAKIAGGREEISADRADEVGDVYGIRVRDIQADEIEDDWQARLERGVFAGGGRMTSFVIHGNTRGLSLALGRASAKMQQAEAAFRTVTKVVSSSGLRLVWHDLLPDAPRRRGPSRRRNGRLVRMRRLDQLRDQQT